ncbi:MAG: alkaline phosphatase family protein [Acidobacteriaceae bacterium]
MKILRYSILLLVSFAVPALATVTVTSPTNGATVTSPVQFTATATATTCSTGVSSMGIYVNNSLVYFDKGAQQINTSLTLSAGAQHTVVEEWDHCGGATSTPINITVGSPSNGQTNGVVVTSPANNSTVTSPVQFVASASTNTCAAGVSSMGVFVDNKEVYFDKGAQQINTSLTLSTGVQHTVVEEWDHCGGALTTAVNITVTAASTPTLTLTADPSSIASGNSSILTATATNATEIVITGTDGSQYTLSGTGGTQSVSPTATTTYTAQASGSLGSTMRSATVTVIPAGSETAIQHVIFMLQENRTFDSYFGMLNPYRVANGWNQGDDGVTYTIDGIDDKLNTISNKDDEGTVEKLYKFTTTCIDDDSSAWEESYGDVNTYDFLATRPILMDGFVHVAEGFAKSCANGGTGCSGQFTDLTGERAMGYYDQTFLNYYYYMASQFAVSDRWFSPVASYSISNRIATFTGGTTQGLVRDPENTDHLTQLQIETIFQELDDAKVSWKIYYTVTDGHCLSEDDCTGSSNAAYPSTDFSVFGYSLQYLHENTTGTCAAPTQPSSVVGDPKSSFCIDTAHIAPLSQYYTDLTNGTLPSFSFIEAGYSVNDEHPSSGGHILAGQAEVAKIVNALMASPEWKNSVFFFSYDEGGGPYDHVPPVPGHSNDFTDASQVANYPDISSIAVNPDSYFPCLPPTVGTPTRHCDLPSATEPGGHPDDAAAEQGFAAQLGFRMPNIVISPFTRKHYVSHIPMDHTAIIKFVENRFIGPSAHLTARDAAQPNLLDFFDFTNPPWATPPTPPTPVSDASLGYSSCQPTDMGP